MCSDVQWTDVLCTDVVSTHISHITLNWCTLYWYSVYGCTLLYNGVLYVHDGTILHEECSIPFQHHLKMWYIWKTVQNRIVNNNFVILYESYSWNEKVHLLYFIEELNSADTADLVLSSDWSVSHWLCSDWLMNLSKMNFNFIHRCTNPDFRLLKCLLSQFEI